MGVYNMNFAEELLNLDEEEIFGKQKSVDIEESDVMKNLGTLANMIMETIDSLKKRKFLLCEDAEQISEIQLEAIEKLGELEKVNKYK